MYIYIRLKNEEGYSLNEYKCLNMCKSEFDDAFYAPFEEELESRMKEDGVITLDSKQYIRQKLTGDGVHTYLQINFVTFCFVKGHIVGRHMNRQYRYYSRRFLHKFYAFLIKTIANPV
mgnify:CR=1 FL=1